MLDMDGPEPAVAVILWGFGGVGKTTLACSVIQDLYSKPTDFKFSRVIIDQETPDKRSHILKLQRDVIFDLGGGKVDLRDRAEGRHQLAKVIKKKSCFISIDNAVDSDIKELLPRLETSNTPQAQKSKLRIIITSRENNVKEVLNIKRIEDYYVEILSPEVATSLLAKTILQGEVEVHEQFDEMAWITSVAQACQGVPILLSVFGNHLKVERKEGGYEDVLRAYKDVLKNLQEGKLDKYNTGDEELLSRKLFFVYEKMRDEGAKEAFLDICTYFHGWEWNRVAHIVDESSLHALQKVKLVNRSESNTVLVHDVLLSIGTDKAKSTRLTNYDEFSSVKDDIRELQNIKGLALLSTTSLISLDCKHLNAMHNSLRVLKLGDWVRLEGPPSMDAFKELRYLETGDLKDFPFKDASKLKKLTVFYNSSKPGMELNQLPQNLKHISYQVPYRDCNTFTKIALNDLKSLEIFRIESEKSVCLPQRFKLPESVINLELTGCKDLPNRFGKLSALQSLTLNKCNMECLPEGLEQLTKLEHVSVEYCANLITLPDGFQFLHALTYLSLQGCRRLEKLPAGFEMLHALRELNIAECDNLSALPDVFNKLSDLQKLDLTRCTKLQELPDSFGKLHLRSLDLHFLASLEELPESFGNLPCLTNLSLISCNSLKRLPNTFDRLTKLESLSIKNCPLVKELPLGFQASSLKVLKLLDCRSVLDLPTGFGELFFLEVLHVEGLPLSSLPDGFGKLINLKVLYIEDCYKLVRVSPDFQNLISLENLWFCLCPVLDGATMDKIVKLQHCQYVCIQKSTKLIDRWNEQKNENDECATYVYSGNDSIDEEEWHRVGRVCLLSGESIQLDITTQELIENSSISVANNTTVVVMSGELHQGQLKRIERANRDYSGQLLIIHVCTRVELHGQPPDKQEEMKRIRQILTLLPPGISYAIPSIDTRRLWLIGIIFFRDQNIFLHKHDQKPFACFKAVVTKKDQDSQNLIFEHSEIIPDEDIGRKSEKVLSSDEENESPYKVEEFINFICEGRAHQCFPGDPPLPNERMIWKFIEALKKNDVRHFVDSNKRMVGMDHLEEKHLAVIMIDLHSPECIKLKEIYGSIQSKGGSFEAIWIAVSQHEDYGFGTYSRVIQHMPGIFLPDPKLINLHDIKNRDPRIIMFNQDGSIANLNALPLILSWGADAYPFKEYSVKQMVSNIHIKSSLDILLLGMNFSTYQEDLNSKCIFLYAEPPCPKFKMNSMLEQFAQTQDNFLILYVGSFFCQKNDSEDVIEVYENATRNMRWPKLSFWDMMKFWYRCKWLLTHTDKLKEEAQRSLSLLERIWNHLVDEKRWLMMLDRDGIVTANGKDVVELMCRSVNEKDDGVAIMKRELRESLQNGKWNPVVRTFFKDEISDYPHHQHPLMLRLKEGGFYCNRCRGYNQWAPHERRAYKCEACDWDLCADCWEMFATEQMKASETGEK